MRSSCHGANYDDQPSAVEMIEGGVADKCRGQAWRVSYPRHLPASQLMVEIQYRQVGCQNPLADATVTIASESEGAIAPSLSVFNAYKKPPTAWPETHRSNLCRNVQHRLMVAQQRGDQALVQLLEQELQQLVCAVH